MAKIIFAIKKILIGLIQGYRYLLSPLLGNCCRFYPSCSDYTMSALDQHGLIRGSFFALKRILRCHPGCEGGIDPVPPQREKLCR